MLLEFVVNECLGDKVSMHHNFSCEYAYNDDGSIPQNEEAPDYLLCWISSNVALKDPVYYVIGDYYFRNDYLYIPFDIPYFIYSVNENKCYSLEEAWETKLPNIENVLAMKGKKGDLYIEAFEGYLKTEHKNAYNEVAGHLALRKAPATAIKKFIITPAEKAPKKFPKPHPTMYL